MAKEKNFNPVQAEKKAEKQKQIRKQKATVQAQRNEKLARRNPARIQRDIDSLKEAEQNGESLRPHERQRLSELEKDLVAVNKARTALGDKAPQFRPERYHDEEGRGERGERAGGGGHGSGSGRGGVLGKRTRDESWKSRDGDESSDTDADVKNIPMPRDTPPPLPRRRYRPSHAEEAPRELKKPILVYEAAPQIRDLRKEAVKFMPASVAQKMKLAKGEGRLLEPDEFDKLQEEGYMNVAKPLEVTDSVGAERPLEVAKPADAVVDSELEDFMKSQGVGESAKQAVEAAIREAEHEMIAAEAQDKIQDHVSQGRVAERKLRQVEIEDAEDEDL